MALYLKQGLLVLLLGLLGAAPLAAGDSIHQAGEIARSGVRAARIAVDIAATNIANAETTWVAPNGGPYQRKFPVLVEADGGVQVLGLQSDHMPPVLVHEPGHPHANAQGFVAKPNIDMAGELLRLNYYSNWLEANSAVLRRKKQMNDAVLELTR